MTLDSVQELFLRHIKRKKNAVNLRCSYSLFVFADKRQVILGVNREDYPGIGKTSV